MKELSHVTFFQSSPWYLQMHCCHLYPLPLTLWHWCRSIPRPWWEPAQWNSTSERSPGSELGILPTTPTLCSPRTKRSLPCSRSAENWRNGWAQPRYVQQPKLGLTPPNHSHGCIVAQSLPLLDNIGTSHSVPLSNCVTKSCVTAGEEDDGAAKGCLPSACFLLLVKWHKLN